MKNYKPRARNTISKPKKLAVYTRDSFRCVYCCRQFSFQDIGSKYLTIDHVIPVAKDGTHNWNNIVTCCLDCNLRKGDDDLMFFLTRHDYDEDEIVSRLKSAFGKSYKEARRNAQSTIRLQKHLDKLQYEEASVRIQSRFQEVEPWRYSKCEF